MPIIIEKEPKELFKEFKVYENCYFCKNKTDTWNKEKNKPIYEECAKKHDISEIK